MLIIDIKAALLKYVFILKGDVKGAIVAILEQNNLTENEQSLLLDYAQDLYEYV